MNLVSASNAETKDQLWAFIRKYAPGATPQTHPFLDKLTDYALAYFNDFVKPTKKFRAATDKERAAFEDLIARLDALPADIDRRRGDPERGLRRRQGARLRAAARLVQGALRSAVRRRERPALRRVRGDLRRARNRGAAAQGLGWRVDASGMTGAS